MSENRRKGERYIPNVPTPWEINAKEIEALKLKIDSLQEQVSRQARELEYLEYKQDERNNNR
jgi:hypothetical protein